MKKSTNNAFQCRTLVIQRETIALLTSRQLGNVAGGTGTPYSQMGGSCPPSISEIVLDPDGYVIMDGM